MLLPLFLVGEAARVTKLWDGLTSAPRLPCRDFGLRRGPWSGVERQ